MAQSGSSMQLTRAADYAVRVMIHLASLPALERTLLPALARVTGTPESFLSKILQALCRAGFVASRRGQSGGFAILAAGRQASVRAVIEAIDGPIGLNVCLVSGASCNRKSFCPAHPIWASAQEAMLSVLDGARVADLAASASRPPVNEPVRPAEPVANGSADPVLKKAFQEGKAPAFQSPGTTGLEVLTQ